MVNSRQGNFVFVGGTQGIGRAAALAAAAAGCAVLLVARDRVAGEEAAADVRAAGASEAAFLSADLSTVSGMAAAASGIAAWKPQIHGILHSAMSAFSKKTVTADGLELAFALQYLARAVINRSCAHVLAASGDGRIVHLAGAVPYKMAKPQFEDLQFERHKWSFFKSILTTHVLGFMFLDEASRRWAGKPITLHATGIGTTRTKVMTSPDMHWIMRFMARFGTTPDKSAQNAIRLLIGSDVPQPAKGLLKNPSKFAISDFDTPQSEAAALWDITSNLARDRGVTLP
jgi:NAD(P)-dependent dehydrogenase (short-subunit alcohol dehydrogenase family)